MQADCLSDPSDVFFYLRVSTISVDNYADTRDKLKTVSALHSCAADRSHFQSYRHALVHNRNHSQDKQIGHEYALFYEAHATHYELKGNCAAADAVYQEGIGRCDNMWAWRGRGTAQSQPGLLSGVGGRLGMPGWAAAGHTHTQEHAQSKTTLKHNSQFVCCICIPCDAAAAVGCVADAPSPWSASSRSTLPSKPAW